MGTYCQEVNQEVTVADLSTTRTFTCPLLVKKTPEFVEEGTIVSTHVQYTFEVAKTEEIFDFLVKEKFITFPKDHRIPTRMNQGERLIVSTISHGTTLLMHVGVSKMSYIIGSTKGYLSSLTRKRL